MEQQKRSWPEESQESFSEKKKTLFCDAALPFPIF